MGDKERGKEKERNCEGEQEKMKKFTQIVIKK
jgi:hypothetical protein